MNRKRVTYYWLIDMLYTMILAIFISTLLVLIFNIVFHFGKFNIVPYLAINLLIVPVTTIFIGLRPVVSLFTIPDTLYKDDDGLYLRNGEKISIENITSVDVKQIGAAQSHMLYYELVLKQLPAKLRIRKRKSLIIIEPFNIRHTFQTRLDFLTILIDLGLDEDKITWSDMKFRHLFGIRDDF